MEILEDEARIAIEKKQLELELRCKQGELELQQLQVQTQLEVESQKEATELAELNWQKQFLWNLRN